ncbi:LOW QUALITY PROTEIN: hypothetical protein PHPALM_28209 [Phytophthora palmivora]|uniref:Core-binding (CB) domain-containing protein n=1 Tax=Phytophthora palmivora TaxID=4796 RepID=A0A2P4XAN3_9STRA|nr:LOW QUALITY PROTEIN: hypothetical protein PHPALM_28209 [Phytophthora palmivora]
MEGTDGFESGHIPNLVLDSTREVALHDYLKVEMEPMITKLQQRMSEKRVYHQEHSKLTELTRFTPADFEAFLLEKRKKVRISTLNRYRSALKDLYRRKEVPIPVAYDKSMATFFSGLKRMQAAKYQASAPKESGKDPLPYSLYQQLCKTTLERQDTGFAHFFLTTQWNLMCRSESVQTLCTQHLSAHDNSVGCTMHKSKTNQEGSGPKDPRHIYANPLNPITCWVTALAIYIACRPLFPGSHQKVRFGNTLSHLITQMTGLNHYGTHSIRKGVATFACSGTTGGPSIASVCLRVGWSLGGVLGGVQDRYTRYESAGDQYLGRVVAGMPLNQAEFALLPPHFANNQDQVVQTSIDEMFPVMKSGSSLQDILKLCMASLVYHHDYLRRTLPTTHPLLSTYLFRHQEIVVQLRKALVQDNSPWMKPTGIPPHVEVYKQLKLMQSSIDNLPPVRLEGISNLIEEKGIAAGNITKQMLESTFENLLERAGIVQANRIVPSQTAISEDSETVHFYKGKFHLLPESFEFPRTGPFGAWVIWWFGDKACGYPPLRKIRPHDLPKASMGKQFSDWSRIIHHLRNAIESTGEEIADNMTDRKATELFQIAVNNLELPSSERKRRLTELSVTTVLRLIRERQSATKRQRLL